MGYFVQKSQKWQMRFEGIFVRFKRLYPFSYIQLLKFRDMRFAILHRDSEGQNFLYL